MIRRSILFFFIQSNGSVFLGRSLDSIKTGNAMKMHVRLWKGLVCIWSSALLFLILVLILHHFNFQYANSVQTSSGWWKLGAAELLYRYSVGWHSLHVQGSLMLTLRLDWQQNTLFKIEEFLNPLNLSLGKWRTEWQIVAEHKGIPWNIRYQKETK